VWGVGRDSAAWAALNAGTSTQSQQHDHVDGSEQSQLSGKERCRTVFVEDNPGWVSGTKASANHPASNHRRNKRLLRCQVLFPRLDFTVQVRMLRGQAARIRGESPELEIVEMSWPSSPRLPEAAELMRQLRAAIGAGGGGEGGGLPVLPPDATRLLTPTLPAGGL